MKHSKICKIVLDWERELHNQIPEAELQKLFKMMAKPNYFSLDIQSLRETQSDAEFRRKLSEWFLNNR